MDKNVCSLWRKSKKMLKLLSCRGSRYEKYIYDHHISVFNNAPRISNFIEILFLAFTPTRSFVFLNAETFSNGKFTTYGLVSFDLVGKTIK